MLGVNLDELLFNQPNSGEEALDTVDKLVESGALGLIIIDSVASLVPEAELAGDIGDQHMGLQAVCSLKLCGFLQVKPPVAEPLYSLPIKPEKRLE